MSTELPLKRQGIRLYKSGWKIMEDRSYFTLPTHQDTIDIARREHSYLAKNIEKITEQMVVTLHLPYQPDRTDITQYGPIELITGLLQRRHGAISNPREIKRGCCHDYLLTAIASPLLRRYWVCALLVQDSPFRNAFPLPCRQL